jgi:hypothetical protein
VCGPQLRTRCIVAGGLPLGGRLLMQRALARIYVVYARVATGLREWPVAAFCNSEHAGHEAQEFAQRCVALALPVRTTAGTYPAKTATVREFPSWADTPSLSKGF